jgi:glutathione S-transferase
VLYADIVIALAVLQFVFFSFRVGSARHRYGVTAPATTGNEIFERHFRVHQNTLEQLIVFLPGMYLFSSNVNPQWAAILGVVFLIGRQIYGASYVKNPTKRGLGFGLTFFPSVILVIGGLVMAIWHLFR